MVTFQEGTDKEETFYLPTILSYISFVLQIILLGFNIKQFNKANIIHILNIEFIIVCSLHIACYFFPFYYDIVNVAVGCQIQSFIFCSTNVMVSLLVISISFLNIKLFTNTEEYENNKRTIFIVQILLCFCFPILLCILLLFFGKAIPNDFHFCLFRDGFSLWFNLGFSL